MSGSKKKVLGFKKPDTNKNLEDVRNTLVNFNQKAFNMIKERYVNHKMFLVIRDVKANGEASFFLHRSILANLEIEVPKFCNKKEKALTVRADGSEVWADIFVTEIEIPPNKQVGFDRGVLVCAEVFMELHPGWSEPEITWYTYFDKQSRLEDYIPTEKDKKEAEKNLIDADCIMPDGKHSVDLSPKGIILKP
jgi:hypothetical protein